MRNTKCIEIGKWICCLLTNQSKSKFISYLSENCVHHCFSMLVWYVFDDVAIRMSRRNHFKSKMFNWKGEMIWEKIAKDRYRIGIIIFYHHLKRTAFSFTHLLHRSMICNKIIKVNGCVCGDSYIYKCTTHPDTKIKGQIPWTHTIYCLNGTRMRHCAFNILISE